ncbi:carbohydrate ABC transporter permease [Haploplasma axanthum]|uniref:Inner membrane ABC transporter permease protein ycjO n=1 Tax=Haploplasma axanthum TaxID=29552 RepID=A0A449BE43_HAPAX|nr:sugar ABC transporter permease [Haploplasma axanthum]VEU80721.1 Inner membrane ABC transporter permease protein ycjO [Haploplasma axanthum]
MKKIKSFFGKLFSNISEFYRLKVSPVFQKIGYALTHNFIFRKGHTQILLFNKIKIKMTRKRRAAFYGFMFIGLWVIGYLVLTLYPMINSLILSFSRAFYNVQTGIKSEYIGAVNYLNIFRNQTLLPLYTNYVTKLIIAVPLIIVFSMIIAMLINQKIKGKGIWRTIFFLPVVISSGPILNELINQGATTLPSFEDNQALNFLFNNVGEWIANPIELILNQLLLVLWYAGVPILVFLAGLQKIDKSIYEASSIDGASPWDNFWKITLPSIKPFISVNIIYVVVSMSMFSEEGGILELAKTHMLSGTSDSTLWFGYGFSAAMMWLYFILMVLIILIFVGLLSIRRRER